MRIMPTRYNNLQKTLNGYNLTGEYLISYDGEKLYPTSNNDDLGSFYIIPKIANSLNLSVDQAIFIFYLLVLGLAYILAMIGFYKLYKSKRLRAISCAGITLITLFSYYVGDVYILSSFIILATIPLLLYFYNQKKLDWKFYLFIFFIGLGISISHLIRSHSGTSMLFFIIILMIFVKKINIIKRLILIALMIIGMIIPKVYFNNLLNKRDAYLSSHITNYKPLENKHVFWHSAYIGLGFLNNDYNINYNDLSAKNKVESLNPSVVYCSKEYEKILKKEVLKIISSDLKFIIETLLAKFGIILTVFLFSANFGFLAFFYRKKDWIIESAFLLAILFNSIFGFLAMPHKSYLLGFIAVSVIYGIFSINEYIIQNKIGKLLN